jgi:4-amino-4-deoxy-L-arabinose transferase-like glycosyltransferase
VELLHVDAARVAREVIGAAAGRDATRLALGIVLIIAIRLTVAALTPLSFDEAYYWLWSTHLAAGYYDHPPLIAFIIRAGTLIFGDTSLGVRFVAWLLSAAATWAVWRAGAIILSSERDGAVAALLFNVMPMIGVEALVATPDAPVIAAAAFLLLALAKLEQTGRASWWLAAGLAAGIGLLSKYTAFFLGAGILAWLVFVPKERRWFLSPWPYLGGALALAMFAPVVLWNAQHDWISFAAQFGRVDAGGFTLRFLGEFLGGQLLLATPFIAILAVAGVVIAAQSQRPGQALLAAMVAPAAVYFLWHSLHDRVQGNWPSFLYPALAIAAAAAWRQIGWPSSSWLLRISKRVAVPVAAIVIAIVYAQALIGIVPGVRDPVSRLLGYEMDRIAIGLESERARAQAGAIITTNYALAAWLTFYLPTRTPVIQINERFRYVNESPPSRDLFEGPLLYITNVRNDESKLVATRFSEVRPFQSITRLRNGAVIDEFEVYRVNGLKSEPLGD